MHLYQQLLTSLWIIIVLSCIKLITSGKVFQSTSVSQEVNMLSRNVVIFAVLFIFGYVQIGVIGLKCYDSSNSIITCSPSNANSTRDSPVYTSIFMSNNTINSTQYGCIAINTTVSNVNKTLKGCTYSSVNCKNQTLTGQMLNEKQCKFCTTDLCNSGPQVVKSLAALALPLVITVFGFKFML